MGKAKKIELTRENGTDEKSMKKWELVALHQKGTKFHVVVDQFELKHSLKKPRKLTNQRN